MAPCSQSKDPRQRGVVEVRTEAERLLAKQQGCPMSLAEVEAEVTQLAVARGIAVSFW
jgi:hypothetical protein